ncbi:protein-L-isoaspartate O-methyltransferase [Streptomyces sp. NPDC059003]|uniref:protein-L-isoaspartate O-methyltransferase family protein n=1 Tax=Streptomyces sp. NPDC059003 TaxID=3346691 RepID=UPI0036785831
MSRATNDLVAEAARDLPASLFHGSDGRAVRPCTPPEVTMRHLRLLDILPGQRILDVGLGSGYSAALASRITGPEGQVTGVDINPELAERARDLYARHQLPVTVHVGDGMLGYSAGAPYERILVGATPPHIPAAWLDQLTPGGVLLSGVRLCELPGSYAIVRVTVDEQGEPGRVVVHHGGYTPMTAEDSHTRPVHRKGNVFIAALAPITEESAGALTAALNAASHSEPSGLDDGEFLHLKNWLIATRPEGLLEATTPHGTGVGVGQADTGGPAAAAFVTDRVLVADSTESPALSGLRKLVEQWRDAGAPETSSLSAALRRDGDRWHVRVAA